MIIQASIEAGPDSQDSEGLVVDQSTSKASDHNMSEHILVVVADFEGEKGAAFLADESISNIYVEYNFLDVGGEELETPFSLAKPRPGEKINFNFR